MSTTTNASYQDLKAAASSRLGALNMALEMLCAIQRGEQFDRVDWHCRIRAIEKGKFCAAHFGDDAICQLEPNHYGGHAD